MKTFLMTILVLISLTGCDLYSDDDESVVDKITGPGPINLVEVDSSAPGNTFAELLANPQHYSSTTTSVQWSGTVTKAYLGRNAPHNFIHVRVDGSSSGVVRLKTGSYDMGTTEKNSSISFSADIDLVYTHPKGHYAVIMKGTLTSL